MSKLANLFDGVPFQIELKFKTFISENDTNLLKWKSVYFFMTPIRWHCSFSLWRICIRFGNSIFKVLLKHEVDLREINSLLYKKSEWMRLLYFTNVIYIANIALFFRKTFKPVGSSIFRISIWSINLCEKVYC